MAERREATYLVSEVFATLQGEGLLVGTAAVFVRFAGCNAWTGRHEDRARDAAGKGACARVCDTDFVSIRGGGGRYGAQDLADVCRAVDPLARLVVLTGGEPLLQAGPELADALRLRDFTVAVETNGSVPLTWRPDHLCVSPKPPLPVVIEEADEVKILVPLYDPAPWQAIKAKHYFVQPVDDDRAAENLRLAIQYVQSHPQWRLSVQTHKHIGLP